ncbi:MAG: hydantoinase/oxoprolinase N-terminal domain-containing protein [Desulfomonilaceae bacterium]
MKLNAAIQINVSQTNAVFEIEDGRAIRVECLNGKDPSFECFVQAIEQGAQILERPPEEIVRQLAIVRVSLPAVADTIVAKRLGTRIGLIVTQGEETTAYWKTVTADPEFDFVISPEMVVAVREEVSDEGRMIIAPDRDEIRDKVRYLLERGVGALVVSFRNGRINPANEKTVKEYIESDYPRHYLGAVPVFIASDFSAEQDDFFRAKGCLLNVYCWAGVDDAISRMQTYLRERKFVGSFLISDAAGDSVPRAGLIPLSTSGALASLHRS